MVWKKGGRCQTSFHLQDHSQPPFHLVSAAVYFKFHSRIMFWFLHLGWVCFKSIHYWGEGNLPQQLQLSRIPSTVPILLYEVMVPGEELSNMAGKHEKGNVLWCLVSYYLLIFSHTKYTKCSDLSGHQMLACSMDNEESKSPWGLVSSCFWNYNSIHSVV